MIIIKRALTIFSILLCINNLGFTATGDSSFSEEFSENLRKGFARMGLAPRTVAAKDALNKEKASEAPPPSYKAQQAEASRADAGYTESSLISGVSTKFFSSTFQIELDRSGTFFPLIFPGLETHSEDGLFSLRASRSPLIRNEPYDSFQNFRLYQPEDDFSYLEEKDPTFLTALRQGRIAPLVFQFFLGQKCEERSYLGHILLYMGRVNDQVKNWFGVIREFEMTSIPLGVGGERKTHILTTEEEQRIKEIPTGIRTIALNLLVKTLQDKAMKSEKFPWLTSLFVDIPLQPVESSADHPLLGKMTFGIVFSPVEDGGRDKGHLVFNAAQVGDKASDITLFFGAGFKLLENSFPETDHIKPFLNSSGVLLGVRLSDLRSQEIAAFKGNYYGQVPHFEGWDTQTDGVPSKQISLMSGKENKELQTKIRVFLAPTVTVRD